MKIRKLFSLLYFLWILLATPSDAIAQVDSVFVGYHMDSTRVMVPSMRFGKSIYDISVSPTQDFMLITFGECDKNGIWEREGHVGGYEIKTSMTMLRKTLLMQWTHTTRCSKSPVKSLAKSLLLMQKV